MELFTKCNRCGALMQARCVDNGFARKTHLVPCVMTCEMSSDDVTPFGDSEAVALCPDCMEGLKRWLAGDDNDSLGKLIDDMERAAAARACACTYLGKCEDDECDGCPALGERCYVFVFNDIARRMHALMPHDADGREIKAGDTIKSHVGMQMDVTDVMPLPVRISDDGTSPVTAGVPHLWRVMEPDSWERLEHDAYHLVMSEYLDTPEDDVKDLVRRAKALAGVE